MTQVSRRTLPRDTEEKLFALFFKSLARLSNPLDIQTFLFDLLSPTEQTMLAKRLAIAILLAKGYKYESIKGILKVSQETIARINMVLNYEGKGYNMVIQKALQDEKLDEVFKKIEDATIAILPNSSVKRALERQRKQNRKPKTSLG